MEVDRRPAHCAIIATSPDGTDERVRNVGGSRALIWLLRHGDAESDAADDASRRLTQKGVDQAEAAGRALAALGIEVNACLTSPKLRALQTAEIVCGPLGVDPEESDGLRGGDFDAEALAAGRADVLLVGHEPDFSRAIRALTGARVKLSKGGLAAIDNGVLVALLKPEQLRGIAGSER
jgi:phosphohistidine phosphatase